LKNVGALTVVIRAAPTARWTRSNNAFGRHSAFFAFRAVNDSYGAVRFPPSE
jgi:hypothetical protein